MAINVARQKLPDLLPAAYQRKIAELSNIKYRLIGLIMLDCGARPGEVVRLRVGDIDFGNRKIRIHSLKKRQQDHYRELRMSERILDSFTIYWKELQHKYKDSYLFPAKYASSEVGYLQAKQVTRWFKKHLGFTPKSCRHTFATRIVRETEDIRMAQKLLGHKSQLTTEIYLHIPQEEMDTAIARIDKQSIWQQLKRKLVKPQRVFWTPVDNGITKFHIGRKAEIAKLSELMDKRVNTLLLGAHGTGKTHLLQNIPDKEGRLIRLDDFNATKKRLQTLLLELYSRDQASIEMLATPELRIAATQEEKEALFGKIISRDSIDNLTDLAIRACKKSAYTLLIDDATGINKAGRKVIEKLKNHFHIIMAARELKIEVSATISNFEIIELKNLPRYEAIDLIQKLSYKFIDQIEDLELYKNHIWDKTGGNPLFIYEFVERYRKEGLITAETITTIEHSSGLQEVDLFPLVVGIIASMSAMRYIVKGTGGDPAPFYLIAGVAMVFLFFGRSIMSAGKRKWV